MTTLQTRGVIVDDRNLQQKMGRFRKDQVPFAMALATNDLAKDVARVERLEIQTEFDRPKPFVVRSVNVIKRATKKDPTAVMSGQGRLNEFRSAYGETVERILRPHIEGTTRRRRSSENRLLDTGQIGPSQYLVGAENFARKDRYGNVPGGIYQQMLSFLRAYRGTSGTGRTNLQTLNRKLGAVTSTRGFRYFVQKAGRGLGIYRVRGKQSPELVFYVIGRPPKYRVRFDFYGIAEQHSQRYADFFAARAMQRALATAR